MNRQQRRAASKAPHATVTAPSKSGQQLSPAAIQVVARANERFTAGDLAGAQALFQQVVAAHPNNPDALHCLAVVANERADFETAARCLQKVVASQPASAEAHYGLGLAWQNLGRLDEAAGSYRAATRLKSGYAEAHSNLGVILFDHGQHEEAAEQYERALAAKPGFGEALHNYGNCLNKLHRPADAIVAYDRAIAGGLTPARAAQAYASRGDSLHSLGYLGPAIESYERALTFDPDYQRAQSNVLFCLNSSPDCDADAIFRRAVEIGGRAANCRTVVSRAPDSAKARLRVGYVSADLGSHPVGYFMEQVLAAHDSAAVEVFCYSNKSEKERVLGRQALPSGNWRTVPTLVTKADEVTTRLRQAADHWREIAELSDDDAAKLIADDGIDILVDLSGHTQGGRLGVFARRPAPVQATWMGYSGTTGHPAMDFIVADRFVIPPGTEQFYSEQVIRLPDSYLCFTPPDVAVSPAPLPADQNGFVTFGSLNNVAKITPEVVRAWTDIVNQVPDSRLLLQWRTLGEPGPRERLAHAFAKAGLAEHRLMLLGNESRASILTRYQDIDLALDPFPYNGTTTTAEALWMGVPVLTVAGDRFIARVGASFLTTVGLGDDLVTDSQAGYAAAAVALANDLPRLRRLRHGLRDRMLLSPLCDGARFARGLEGAFRSMWDLHCRKRAERVAA